MRHLLTILCFSAIGAVAEIPESPQPGADPQATVTFELGRKHLRGDGVEKDTARAFALIREAAEAGHPDAMGAMGYFYASAVEVQQDTAKAAEWFRRGAEAGSPKAQFNLGNALLRGTGIPRDEAAGVGWIQKAAAAGLPEAQNRLGFAYLHGNDLPGIPADSTKAFEMFTAAAAAGLPDAQNAYGLMLGEAGEHEASLTWFRRSAQQGFAKAQANLGRALIQSAGADDSELRVEGLKWLLLAESAGEPTARNSLHQLTPACSSAEIAGARQRAETFKPTAEPAR